MFGGDLHGNRPVGRAVTQSSLKQEVKPRAGQIGHSFVNATAVTFFSKEVVLTGAIA